MPEGQKQSAEADLRAEAQATGAESSEVVVALWQFWSEATKTTDPLGRATGPF
jgi:hypothetical protein